MSWLSTPAHARWLEAEGDRLLEFGRGSWHPGGGFAWLGEDGTPELDRPRELWVTCRMTHVYALAHLMGRPGAAAYVDHGLAALAGAFHDDRHGGWFAQVDDGGASRQRQDGLRARLRRAGRLERGGRGPTGGEALLDEALAVFLEHFWDDRHGMAVEQWDRGWTRLDDYRGVNANMHTVEALLAAADVDR